MKLSSDVIDEFEEVDRPTKTTNAGEMAAARQFPESESSLFERVDIQLIRGEESRTGMAECVGARCGLTMPWFRLAH
jgi:hypothetical protein